MMVMAASIGGAGAVGAISAPPTTILLYAAFAIVGCSVGLVALVFGIWSIILLLRYRRHFHDAAKDARANWNRELKNPAQ